MCIFFIDCAPHHYALTPLHNATCITMCTVHRYTTRHHYMYCIIQPHRITLHHTTHAMVKLGSHTNASDV